MIRNSQDSVSNYKNQLNPLVDVYNIYSPYGFTQIHKCGLKEEHLTSGSYKTTDHASSGDWTRGLTVCLFTFARFTGDDPQEAQ